MSHWWYRWEWGSDTACVRDSVVQYLFQGLWWVRGGRPTGKFSHFGTFKPVGELTYELRWWVTVALSWCSNAAGL